jgi:hypothetical protein
MTTIRALVLILIGVAVGSLFDPSMPRQTSCCSKSASDSSCRISTNIRSTARSSRFVDRSCVVNSPSRLTRSPVFPLM